MSSQVRVGGWVAGVGGGWGGGTGRGGPGPVRRLPASTALPTYMRPAMRSIRER